MNCPICNHSINPSSQFCINCDFEVMIISNDASDVLKQYVLNRQEKFIKNYQGKNNLKLQLEKLEKDLIQKIKEFENANTLIKKQTEQINKFKGKVATTQDELNRLKSYENLAKEKVIEIEKLQSDIVVLNKKVVDTTKFKEIDRLLKELINKLSGGNNELHREFVSKYNKI